MTLTLIELVPTCTSEEYFLFLICVNLEWREEVYGCKKSRKVWMDLVAIPAGHCWTVTLV